MGECSSSSTLHRVTPKNLDKVWSFSVEDKHKKNFALKRQSLIERRQSLIAKIKQLPDGHEKDNAVHSFIQMNMFQERENFKVRVGLLEKKSTPKEEEKGE